MVSIIITHRGKRRLDNLRKVVDNYLSFNINNEIIIIEQDSNEVIREHIPDKCEYRFAYNPGLFNKSWGFNIGYKISKNNLILFSDSDILFKYDNLKSSIDKIDTYGSVRPYKKLVDVDRPMSSLSNDAIFNIDKPLRSAAYAGGAILFNKNAFEMVGGWDERFRGWGCEDSHLLIKIIKIIGKKHILDKTAWHLWHDRLISDTNKSPMYNMNRKIYDDTRMMTKNQILRSVDLSKIGNIDKYVGES